MVDFKHGLTRPVYYSIQRNLGLYSNYRVKSIGWHATTTATGSPTEIIVDTSKLHTSLCPRGYRGKRLTTSPSSGIENSGRCSASPACGSNLRSKFRMSGYSLILHETWQQLCESTGSVSEYLMDINIYSNMKETGRNI